MSDAFVIGVDGCPYGWLAVQHFPLREQRETLEARLFPSFEKLIRSEWGQATFILVDIPIGLAERGRRGCDRLARQLLGAKRASSVFPAPRRPMLTMATYDEANNWGKSQGREAGGGLSKQAWNILPKIKEVDASITPDLQNKIREAHPEVAFHRLNTNTPLLFSKKKPEGREERLTLLRKNGLIDLEQTWQTLMMTNKRVDAAMDDFLDAAALSLTAAAMLHGGPVHHLTEKRVDARGLRMEIWG